MKQYENEQISLALKKVRKEKALSQRELSSRSGVPQGHISKIENGAVDLRLSSLIALSRLLDMELMLVPRKNVSAVNSIVRSGKREIEGSNENPWKAVKELKNIEKIVFTLPKMPEYRKEIGQLAHRVRELNNLRLSDTTITQLKEISNSIARFKKNTNDTFALKESLSQIEGLRNALAHSAANTSEITIPKSAYSLDDFEDA